MIVEATIVILWICIILITYYCILLQYISMSFHVFPRIWGGRKLIRSWAPRLNRGGPTYPNGTITFFFNSCPKDVAHWLEFLWELLKVVVCLALQCCSQPRWRVYWCFVCFHCLIAIRSNPDVIHICDLLCTQKLFCFASLFMAYCSGVWSSCNFKIHPLQ